jgi:hypothetical protein
MAGRDAAGADILGDVGELQPAAVAGVVIAAALRDEVVAS